MKNFLTGVITGVLPAVIISVVFFLYQNKEEPLKDVKTTQVSGEKIEHSGFNYKSGNIKFTTKAEGKGEIITEIPKTNIPEARYWLEDNNAVMLELLLTEEDRIYGIDYMRRWGNFSAGGGVLFSERKFEGIKIQSMYWFKI